ncbi:MAG: tRNA 2-thiouridine synthesizing protein [Methanosarcinales archaeon]|nr:MAG: SirA-like protein [Euryarchaeota archaeon 55_53]KUK30003.1 MAG: SirA-like protein [Methanosarcinales archeaon 56_1174]MDI3487750.1 tRNA 2-thiouridine synthesizing protein [Methanosarcinales archaeon]MDN5294894.1 tRNA 2-thiouridine synthesizing protein [Methanosarcinales archaeon]
MGKNHVSIEFDLELDLGGAACPVPTLKTKVALLQMGRGEVLRVRVTNPRSAETIPRELKEEGELVGWYAEEGSYYIYLRRR